MMPEWQARLEANPELMLESTPFEVRIPRAFGALVFTHGKPVAANKVMPVYPGRIVTGTKNDATNIIDDLPRLIEWLTGGPDGNHSSETDIYGIAELDLDMDVSGALSEIVLFADGDEDRKKKAAKSYEEIQKELIKKSKLALEKAREIADQRVKRQLKKTHEFLIKQYDKLAMEGKGRYAPSTAEAIGVFILKKETDKAAENRRKMFDEFNKELGNVNIMM